MEDGSGIFWFSFTFSNKQLQRPLGYCPPPPPALITLSKFRRVGDGRRDHEVEAVDLVAGIHVGHRGRVVVQVAHLKQNFWHDPALQPKKHSLPSQLSTNLFWRKQNGFLSVQRNYLYSSNNNTIYFDVEVYGFFNRAIQDYTWHIWGLFVDYINFTNHGKEYLRNAKSVK